MITNYSEPNITEEDIAAVVTQLKSGWLAGGGEMVRRYEDALAAFTGYKYAVSMNSATTALFLLYKIMYRPMTHIKVPALTFVATANAAIMNNMLPKVVDIDEFTLTAEHADVGVSYAGYPVFNTELADDAHSIYPGMANWKYQDAVVVSTHALKTITTGEGGAVLTNDKTLAWQLRSLVDHGRGDHADFEFGYNFRLPALNAALGHSQLRRATGDIARRKELAERYYRAFADLKDWFINPPFHKNHCWHLYPIRLIDNQEREDLRHYLMGQGFRCVVHYPPLLRYEHIKKLNPPAFATPVADRVADTILSIPLYSGMTDEIQDQVIGAIYDYFERPRPIKY